MNKSTITIIGAGIGGLTLALALNKLGIKCQLFEKWPYERLEGSSFRISSSGTHVLKELGVIEEIKKNSFTAESIKILTTTDEEFAHINLFQSQQYEDRSIFMKRSDLIEILTKTALDAGIDIHYHKQLEDVNQTKDNVVAHFQDGSSIQSKLLVGADGLHSTVRNKLFPNTRLSFLNCWALYGTLSLEDTPAYLRSLLSKNEVFFLDKGFNFVVSICNENHHLSVNWQATGYLDRKLPVNEFDLLSQDEIKQFLFSHFSIKDSLKELVEKTFKIIPKQPHTVEGVLSWSKQRVALIGDAAHGMNPNTGYGSAVAMEDALYLARLLKEHTFYDAFYYYEHDRKNRVQAIQHSTEIFDMSKGIDLRKSIDIGLFSGSQFDPNYKVTLFE